MAGDTICLHLAYFIRVLSQFCNHRGQIYIELLKYVLPYMSGTFNLSLKFNGKADTPDDIIEYTDCNFVKSKTDKK